MFLSKNDYFKKNCWSWALICEALCFSAVLLCWAGLFCPEFAPPIPHVLIYSDSAFEISWCAVPSSLTLGTLCGWIWETEGAKASQCSLPAGAPSCSWALGTHHILELSRILAFPPLSLLFLVSFLVLQRREFWEKRWQHLPRSSGMVIINGWYILFTLTFMDSLWDICANGLILFNVY